MPRFQPKSDKELAAENLLPIEPIYDFEIMGAEDKTFKTGSVGIALKVGIYTETGAVRFVNDNLIFQDNCMFKVSQFCKAVGLYERYKAGHLDAEDCRSRTGKCKLKIEPEGEYPAKNIIGSYVVPKPINAEPARSQPQSARVTSAIPAPAPAPTTGKVDDDIPF